VLLKDPSALRFLERVELQREVLLVCLDSGVANDHNEGAEWNERGQLRSVDYVINCGALWGALGQRSYALENGTKLIVCERPRPGKQSVS
jgi:hypothetical protein